LAGAVAPPGRCPEQVRECVVFARSTTIQARPSSIEAGIAHIRDEVMPALLKLDGCAGLSLLVDRQSGRCIATSAWEHEKAMHASGEQVLPMQQRAAEVLGGSAIVDRWEIAFLHRDHSSNEGAGVRVTWLHLQPGQFDQAIEFYKTSVLPAIQMLEGFCSVSLMFDRASCRAVSSATFDSREAMERNRDQATAFKITKIREGRVEEIDECEFDLALAHLRIPELS
jgi:hypothetical protein